MGRYVIEIVYTYHVFRLKEDMLVPVNNTDGTNVVLGGCKFFLAQDFNLYNGVHSATLRDLQLFGLLNKHL